MISSSLSSIGIRPRPFSHFQRISTILLCIYLQAIVVIKCSTYGQRISPLSSYKSSSTTPIQAAINTHHVINHIDVETPKEQYQPNLIEVKSTIPMFHINFKSSSSKVNVFHEHHSAMANKEPIESFSQDEPHILRHQVVKPIVQQIHEIITPVRKIVQEINPVQETIETIIARSSTSPSSSSSSSSSLLSPIAPIAQPPTITSTSSSLQSKLPNIDEMDLKLQKAFIGDLNQYLSTATKRPDLLIRNENEILDNHLYNGANEYDLKYPSLNTDNGGNNNLLSKSSTSMLLSPSSYDLRLYRD